MNLIREGLEVLVTGGSGFVGSHIVEEFSRRGMKVTVIDRLARNEYVRPARGLVDYVESDLADNENLRKAIRGKNLVIHLASNSDIGRSSQNPDLDFRDTLMPTYEVLKAMRENNVRHLVYFSSGAVYGESTKPFSENYGPLFPISPYGAAKLASEAWISAFARMCGIRAWIFRPSNIVGERQTHGVVFDFVKKLRANPTVLEVHGNGKQTKSYTDVKDVVSGVMSARW